jgi:hypothetical protein
VQILQLIANEPQLQISTTKTKYLAPFHFADIVNISVYINFENCLDISLQSQLRGVNLKHGFALLIYRRPYFSGLRFDSSRKNEIGCMYQFDICNNLINSNKLYILNVSRLDDIWFSVMISQVHSTHLFSIKYSTK